jgi:cytochrome d ubiquinol oxidase subunit I
MNEERTAYTVEVPLLGSLILTHSFDGRVPGLKDFPAADRPNSELIFYTFRIMVGLGMLMLLQGVAGLYLRWRGSLYQSKWLLRFALTMGPAGFVALLCGWVTTEVGRQPYTVYGVLRTVDSVSAIALPGIATSMVAFVIVYFIVFGAGVAILLRMMGTEPHDGEKGPDAHDPTRTAGTHPGPAQGSAVGHAGEMPQG